MDFKLVEHLREDIFQPVTSIEKEERAKEAHRRREETYKQVSTARKAFRYLKGRLNAEGEYFRLLPPNIVAVYVQSDTGDVYTYTEEQLVSLARGYI